MSSRKLLTLLDGLPGDSWYKLSVQAFVEELKDQEERKYATDVGGLIFAQLTGQHVEAAEDT